jgi:hypothetical protein
LTPYRVYSNPLVADADFDGVVDGDEPNFGSNPTYRADRTTATRTATRRRRPEFNARTNPLIEDFQVTVLFNGLSSGGWRRRRQRDTLREFMFQLGVRKPDLNGTAA